MDPRRSRFCLLLALLVAVGSVAAAGQQGAARGMTATALQPTTGSASSDGSVFATPNLVALANTMGWENEPPPSGAAEPGEQLLGGPSPSEWAASENGTGEADYRAVRTAIRGSGYTLGSDRPTPELCRLCVYRL